MKGHMSNENNPAKNNLAYLNPTQQNRRFSYALVDAVSDGEATQLIGADGETVAVSGTLAKLPTLEVGDWVQVMEAQSGAYIVKPIEITPSDTISEEEMSADGWYEYFVYPVMRDISIDVVCSGWIVCGNHEKYIHLSAEAFSIRSRDGHLLHFVRDKDAMRIRSDSGKARIRMESVNIRTTNLSIRLNTPTVDSLVQES
jgi:hypothetical protein